MLKLIFWEDEDKKEDGYQYHCCGVDESEVDGILNTWYREANYEIAKEKMLENLKRLRDDIDDLIKEEEKNDKGKEMKIGSKVKNKICPKLVGTIKKLCSNDTAIIEITDKYLSTKELMICTENWEVVE